MKKSYQISKKGHPQRWTITASELVRTAKQYHDKEKDLLRDMFDAIKILRLKGYQVRRLT